MRVMLVAGTYPPDQCGIGDYTERLANALALRSAIEVGVLTTSTPERAANDTIEVIDAATQWAFSELPRVVNTTRTWKPDLVHIQYPSQGFFRRKLPSFLPLVFRFMGIRVVQTWHEPHRMRGLLHFLLQWAGANGMVFVRPNYLDMLPAIFRWCLKWREKIVIPNASALPLSLLDNTQRYSLRTQYMGGEGRHRRLVVFFGFLYPQKGVELLFDIADPSRDVLVIAGSVKDRAYVQQLAEIAYAKGWQAAQLHFTGFLSPEDAADLLAIADAVVLPFLTGGGDWNTSIHSALAQGTLVITTALPPRGDEPERNLFTAAPLDIGEMRAALDRLAGRRVVPASTEDQWQAIAKAHMAFYQRILRTSTSGNT